MIWCITESRTMQETVEKKEEKTKVTRVKKEKPVWNFKCNSAMLKRIVKYTQYLDEEIPFKITKEGIEIVMVDPSHVMMATIEIPRTDFITGSDAVHKTIGFSLNVDELKFGVDVDKLNRNLNLFNHYDNIEGRVENGLLFMDCDSVHTQTALIDIRGRNTPKLPTLELSIKATVETKLLQLLCKEESISDHIILCSADGLLTGTKEMDDDLIKIDLSDEVKGEGRAIYSTDYFKNILVETYDDMEICFGPDLPLRAEGDFGTKGKYVFFLAPRIESG